MIDTLLRVGVYGVLVVLAVVLSVGVLAFLGGMASAAVENHRERAAGLPVSRPAWEQRRKRRARGHFSTIKALWARAQTHGRVELCWCVCGPVQWFTGWGVAPETREGFGCAAWESGDPVAFARHSKAGGYARTPDRDAFRMVASDA